ncbi:MAG: glutamine-hydrolyzing GMP synthase [Clostridiales Family XIII bacterium]|jgi:GMP synthase (glutamine-hydrolysing)|nr:glutamine-hydrolyzing GMP synthase [Clostridiales Family XIII bacterium]
MNESIWVVDFGGQYNQLIARRVREAHVYAEVVPYFRLMERIYNGERPSGIIFTGGPSSVYEEGAPTLPASLFSREIPILGICYGAQLMAHVLGGKVVSPDFKEYGRISIRHVGEEPTIVPAAVAEDLEPLPLLKGEEPASEKEEEDSTAVAAPKWVGRDDANVSNELLDIATGVVEGPSTEEKEGVSIRVGRFFGMKGLREDENASKGSETEDNASEEEVWVDDREWPSKLFAEIDGDQRCWMSHTDYIDEVPDGFVSTSYTANCPTASMENPAKNLYAVQFHPEVHHTPFGQKLIENFLRRVCECKDDWNMASFAKQKIEEIRETVGEKKVLCALSGGVDSSVAAVLTHEAIGDNLTCIFVDHGLLRKNEGDQVMDVYGQRFNMKIKRVDAAERFLKKLEGVDEPEEKRKIIGAEFIAVFEEEAKKLLEEEGEVEFLLQGTIYPDVVESGSGEAAVIKSHHNVGGLPEHMNMTLIEPLRLLFKDEVRAVGEELGIAPELVWRQPFPGPGLAIRCLGAVTEEKLEIIRESDAILREEIDAYNEALFAKTGKRNYGATYDKDNTESAVWQYFTVLPNIRSVGVMGDARTYDYAVGILGVTSVEGMTSDWARLPYDVLELISNRIVNEVKGVNRVLYDLTSKPPGTIEWE